jgi:hypothetical protein
LPPRSCGLRPRSGNCGRRIDAAGEAVREEHHVWRSAT